MYTDPGFQQPKKALENTVQKGEPAFSPILTFFSTLSKTGTVNLAMFQMSSANVETCLKFCSLGKSE